MFGGKNHTTVMHSVEKIKKEIMNDSNLEAEINKIINKIKQCLKIDLKISFAHLLFFIK